MKQQEDMVMTVEEVSIYLKLGKSTVYKLVQEGKLPGRKVGGTWRFSRVGIEEWLRERPLPSHAEAKDSLYPNSQHIKNSYQF